MKHCKFWTLWLSALPSAISSNRWEPEHQFCQKGRHQVFFLFWTTQYLSRPKDALWLCWHISWSLYPENLTWSHHLAMSLYVLLSMSNTLVCLPHLIPFHYPLSRPTYQSNRWQFPVVCFWCHFLIFFWSNLSWYPQCIFWAFLLFNIFSCRFGPWILSWQPRRCTCMLKRNL